MEIGIITDKERPGCRRSAVFSSRNDGVWRNMLPIQACTLNFKITSYSLKILLNQVLYLQILNLNNWSCDLKYKLSIVLSDNLNR